MGSTVSDRPGLHGARRVLHALAEGTSHAHAVLFYGQDGAGMDDVARELARVWLVRGPDDPVGKAFDAGRAVDFQEVAPAGPSAQIKLSAVQARSARPEGSEEHAVVPLIEFFRSPPLMARHKVFLIRSADRLNRDAANALLKTLEEPHPHGKVILTTAELSRVMPTVRSRCLAVACELPTAEEWAPSGRMERLFGPTPGLAETVRAHAAAYEGLLAVLDLIPTAPAGGALGLAWRYRDAAERLAASRDSTARAAQAEALRCAAAWFRAEAPDRPDLALAAVEAHRLVLQNLNAGPVFDALFAEATARKVTGVGPNREQGGRSGS